MNLNLSVAIELRYCRDRVAIDIANVHLGLWSSSHSSVACFLVCKITNQLLLATGSASLQVWAGLVSVRGWDSNENNIIIIVVVAAIVPSCLCTL